MKLHRVASISLFVILGIILLLVIIILAGITLNRNKAVLGKNDIQFSTSHISYDTIKNYMNLCAGQAIEDTMAKVGLRPGDEVLIDEFGSGTRNSRATDEFTMEFTGNFRICMVSIFDEIEKQGYMIEKGELLVDKSFSQDSVILQIEYPLSIKKGNTQFTFDKISKTIPLSSGISIKGGVAKETIVLRSQDNRAALIIPAGTELKDQEGNSIENLKIITEDRTLGGVLSNNNVIGETIYKITPDVVFSRPAELKIEFSRSQVSSEEDAMKARLGWLWAGTNVWMMYPTNITKQGEDGFSASTLIEHASTWAVSSGPCGSDSAPVDLAGYGPFVFNKYVETNYQIEKQIEPIHYMHFQDKKPLLISSENGEWDCTIDSVGKTYTEIFQDLICTNDGKVVINDTANLNEIKKDERGSYKYSEVIRDNSETFCNTDKIGVNYQATYHKDNRVWVSGNILVQGYGHYKCAGGKITGSKESPLQSFVFPNNGDACLNDNKDSLLPVAGLESESEEIKVHFKDSLQELNVKGIIEGCSETDWYLRLDKNKDRLELCSADEPCFNLRDPAIKDYWNIIIDHPDKRLSFDQLRTVIQYANRNEWVSIEDLSFLEGADTIPCRSKEGFTEITDSSGTHLAIDLLELEVSNENNINPEGRDLLAKIDNYQFGLEEGTNVASSQRLGLNKNALSCPLDRDSGDQNLRITAQEALESFPEPYKSMIDWSNIPLYFCQKDCSHCEENDYAEKNPNICKSEACLRYIPGVLKCSTIMKEGAYLITCDYSPNLDIMTHELAHVLNRAVVQETFLECSNKLYTLSKCSDPCLVMGESFAEYIVNMVSPMRIYPYYWKEGDSFSIIDATSWRSKVYENFGKLSQKGEPPDSSIIKSLFVKCLDSSYRDSCNRIFSFNEGPCSTMFCYYRPTSQSIEKNRCLTDKENKKWVCVAEGNANPLNTQEVCITDPTGGGTCPYGFMRVPEEDFPYCDCVNSGNPDEQCLKIGEGFCYDTTSSKIAAIGDCNVDNTWICAGDCTKQSQQCINGFVETNGIKEYCNCRKSAASEIQKAACIEKLPAWVTLK